MPSRRTRRGFLATGLVALASSVTGCLGDPTSGSSTSTDATSTQTSVEANGQEPSTSTTNTPSPTATLPDAVGTELIAEGFTAPLDVEFVETGTVLVADQAGRVHHVTDGSLRDRPLLDVRDRMVSLSGYEERGLLGIALGPTYPEDPRIFVRYSAPRGDGTPSEYSHTFVLSSFEVDPDALVADLASEQRILEIPQPQSNHNAGAIAFGPEGHLYVGVGDGGGASDTGRGHVDDWYDENAGGNGQDVSENLLGSILRIDVADTDASAYSIPTDNPLVGQTGRDEHFAWGFRNPWRFSFHEGRLYAADVGQNRFEEIDHVRKGGNYGWNVREGSHCFSTSSPSEPPDSCPSETADGEPLVDPVIEYPHSGQSVSGVAVIGGYFYTGSAIPGLRNRYVFVDWQADSRLFVGTPTGEGSWRTDVLPVEGPMGSFVLGFGREPEGDLYVVTSDQTQVRGTTGALYRLLPA